MAVVGPVHSEDESIASSNCQKVLLQLQQHIGGDLNFRDRS